MAPGEPRVDPSSGASWLLAWQPDTDRAGDLVAYCGPPPGPDALWARWNLDPWLLLGLLGAALVWTAWAGRSGPGAQRHFYAALAVATAIFVSPLCAASAALFSARVLHHVLLVAVVAPLLALALASARLRTPVLKARRRPASPLGLPLLAASGVLYLWHAPPLYDLALRHDGLYWLMQLSLLGSATAFWRTVLAPRTPPALGLLAIVASAGLMGLLGALLTFAPEPLYLAHRIAPLAFGLTALDDQRLGGLIMWVPALLPYALCGALTAQRWVATISPMPSARP